MSELYSHIEKLDFDDILSLIEDAYAIFRAEYGRGVISNISGSEAVIIGDIHGDYDTLKMILDRIEVTEFLEGDNRLIFLGDIVDRGPHQVESLNLILYLKVIYGDRVILIRGNHEPPPFLPTFPHDFPYKLISRFGNKGGMLYQSYFRLFQVLPHVAVTSNSLFLVHGGIPPNGISIEELKNPSRKILEYLLWSDPFEGEGSIPSWRGAGHRFGEDITRRFLNRNKLVMIIRGHEPCEGYKLNHGKLVLTLFSRVGDPYFNYTAGFLRIGLRETLDPDVVANSIGLIRISE